MPTYRYAHIQVCPHTGIFRPHFTFFARSKAWNRRPSNWTPSMKCLHIRAAKLFFRVSALQTLRKGTHRRLLPLAGVKTSKQYTLLTTSSRPPKDQCLITVEECSKIQNLAVSDYQLISCNFIHRFLSSRTTHTFILFTNWRFTFIIKRLLF